MIHEFRIKNFFSIADEQVVSFRVPKTAPYDDRFVEGFNGIRLTKLLGVFGPNASGKTNVLRAFSFFSWFARHSFMGRKSDRIPRVCYRLTKTPNPESSFYVIFEHNGMLYDYNVVITTSEVLIEVLRRKKRGGRFNLIYKREKDKIVLSSDISITKKMVNDAGLVRSNATFLSAAKDFDKTLSAVAQCMDWSNNVSYSGREPSIPDYNLIERIENEKGFADKISKYLVDYDIGLKSITVKKIVTSKKFKVKFKIGDSEFEASNMSGNPRRLLFIHKSGSDYYEMPEELVSSGTTALLIYLNLCLEMLPVGGVAVIDELGNDLHPHIVPKILDIFISRTTNPNNAQILFSSHTIDLFHDLDKVQILLVDKGEDLKSKIYRLDEVINVRRDENIYAKYHAGAYGAIPRV